MSGHSAIGPSSAERWIACPGSVALSAKCAKPPTNKYAAEGTVAHGLAEELVSGKLDDFTLMSKVGAVVECDGHEITIDDEMIEGVLLYRDTIAADYDALKAQGKPAAIQRLAEKRVHIRSISEDLWGTADYILFQKGNRLKVYDFKYGKNVVEAEENEQMGLYVLGAIEEFAGEAFDEIEQIIVQPRVRHADGVVRRWVVPKDWLVQFRAKAHAAVDETKSPNARLVAGDHCRWCPAQSGGCPAIFAEAQAQTRADFSVEGPTETEIKAGELKGLPDAKLMTVEELGRALGWQDAVESFFSAVKDRVREMLENGQAVPGWKLVEGRSNRKWRDEAAVVERYGVQLGERLFEKKILSPAKLEAVVGKKKVDDLTFKPEAKRAVARDTDPRRVAPSSAQSDFDPFGGGVEGILVPPAQAPALLDGARKVELVVDPFALPAAGDLEAQALGKKEPMWPQ